MQKDYQPLAFPSHNIWNSFLSWGAIGRIDWSLSMCMLISCSQNLFLAEELNISPFAPVPSSTFNFLLGVRVHQIHVPCK